LTLYAAIIYHIDISEIKLLLFCTIIWLEYIKTFIFAKYLNHNDSIYNI